MIRYIPEGICPKEIQFDVKDNKVKQVQFIGGCPGNLRAISYLVEDMEIENVVRKFKGNLCRNGTSCTDQLARALESIKNDTK